MSAEQKAIDLGRAVACVKGCEGIADPTVIPEFIQIVARLSHRYIELVESSKAGSIEDAKLLLDYGTVLLKLVGQDV